MTDHGLVGLLLLASCLVACATPGPLGDLRFHLVVADHDGYPLQPRTGERIPGEGKGEILVEEDPGEAPSSFEERVRRMFRNAEATLWKSEDRKRLLVHVHGGLNGYEGSRDRAEELFPMILAADGSDRAYPIFLTWNSDGIGSLGEHLFRTRYGVINPVLAKITFPVVLASDLAAGVARSPRMLSKAVGFEIGSPFAYHDMGEAFFPKWRLARKRYEHFKQHTGMDINHGEFEHRSGLDQGLRFLQAFVLFPVRYVLGPLVIDGLGEEAWTIMLRRSENAFHMPNEFDARAEGGDPVVNGGPPPGGAFYRFFRILQEHVAGHPGNWEITLVGHSMGAIVLNRALQEFPDLPVSRIVYMAPACSCNEARESVVPFLASHPDTQFYVLALHEISESSESNALDTVPRGSLLEWIDYWYTNPTTVADMRFGKWENLMATLHLFDYRDPAKPGSASTLDRVHVKVFGRKDGHVPEKHGDFSKAPFWTKAFIDPSVEIQGFLPVVE
jgi:pimeloyl-ACP methyl ester carboxylesterase